uniref:Uncharacterized protein n=1 Tax=Parascaris equorum TaxID=6256 RepID=A0A914S172_PAREQ
MNNDINSEQISEHIFLIKIVVVANSHINSIKSK